MLDTIVQDGQGRDVGTFRCRMPIGGGVDAVPVCETTGGTTLRVYDGLFCSAFPFEEGAP